MAIDRGDYHFDSAGSWERACRHIGLYLAWAAARGLASEEHDAKAAAKNPTKYFIGACDTKLWDDDFTAAGLAFTNATYTSYLKEVERYAKKCGIDDYAIPESAETTQHFYAFLDKALASYKPKAKAKAKPKAKAKSKPKRTPKAKPKSKSKPKAKR